MCDIQQTLNTILRPNRASPSVDVKVNTVRMYGRSSDTASSRLQNYNSSLGKQSTDVTDTLESTGNVCRNLIKTTTVFMMRCVLRSYAISPNNLLFFHFYHFVARGGNFVFMKVLSVTVYCTGPCLVYKALAGVLLPCSLTSHFTLTLHLSYRVYKWVSNAGVNPAMN